MKEIIIILLGLVSLISAASEIEPFGTEICRLFANGVLLRSPGSCKDYITCQDGKSIIDTCANGKLFDISPKTPGCVNESNLSKVTYCGDPCTSKTNKKTFLADPKTCNGYFKCDNLTGTHGSCQSNFHFYEKTEVCVYPEDSPCKGFHFCDIVPNGIDFKDESSCDMFNRCVSGKFTTLQCPSGYYHPQLGCTKKSDVECTDHPTPNGVCGTEKKPIRNKFVNDDRTCRGYLYCSDKGDNTPDPSPSWGQCPNGYFFDFEQQACFTASDVVCDEDRCDGQNRDKVISGTPGCQHYFVCNGDLTVREEQCADGMYFDDSSMTCTTSVKKYVSCS